MYKECISTYIAALSSLKIKEFLNFMKVNIEIPDLLDQWFSDNQITNCLEAAEIGALCLKRFSYITRVVQVWYTGGTTKMKKEIQVRPILPKYSNIERMSYWM